MNSDRRKKLYSPVRKILLIANLPIDRRHGAFIGREFAMLPSPKWDRRSGRIWFQAADGVACACWPNECQPVSAPEESRAIDESTSH